MKNFLVSLSFFWGLILVGICAFAQNPTITYTTTSYNFTVGTAIASFGPTSATGVTGSFPATTTFATAGGGGTTFGVITYDPVNACFYALANGALYKITTAGVITTLVPNGTLSNNNSGTGIITDGSGNIYVSDVGKRSVYEFNSAGTQIRKVTGFTTPNGLAVDNGNDVYVADGGTGDIYKIPAGVVNTMSVFLNGFSTPYGVLINAVTGDMYVSQNGGSLNLIKIAGAIGGGVAKTTLAPGTNFTIPRNLTFDSFGDLFLADGTTVKMITTAGIVTTALNGLATPGQVAFDPSGNMYIADGGRTIKESAVTYYSINTPLPAGLLFNTTTGVISGTPTVASPQNPYVITVHNTSGTASATIKITCTLSPPAFTYATPQIYIFGTFASLTPGNTGGAATSCGISPALPAGLSISAAGVISGTPTAISGATVYTITPSNTGGAGISNTVTITVNPASLTITANNTNKTYGAANPALTVTYAGFVNGNTSANLTTQPTISTTAVTTSAAGTYPITAIGAVDPNYIISYAAGTLTVNPASLTVTAKPQAKNYGTTFTFAGTEFTTSGLLFSDAVTSVTLTSAGSAATATVAAGPYSIIPTAAVGSGLSNYTITYTNGLMTINTVPLTITAKPQTKVYGSTFTFAGTEFTTSGLLNTDNVTSATITSTGSVATATVAGSPYPIIPSNANGAGLTNYNITYVNGSMTVTPAVLTITANSQTRSLGVNTNFTVTYSGFVNGETAASLTTQATATCTVTAAAPVGVYPNTITATGAVDVNYSFTYVPGTLTIAGASGNIYDWTGAVNNVWETPQNWDINNVQQTVAYPGSTNNADIVDIGVNAAIPAFITFPVMSAANLTIASLTFGNNNAPSNTTGGTLGLTVNGFTLAVTGAILQEHSNTGNSGGFGTSANGIITTLQGSGFITCASFTVGNNTIPAGQGHTVTRVNIGGNAPSALSVTVTGNLIINSATDGFFVSFDTNDAYLSLGAGTLTVDGTVQLTNFVTGFVLFNFPPNPYAKFSIDLNNNNSPVLNLLGANPISIAASTNTSNVVDFNNPATPSLTGTVNYGAALGPQKVYTSADANFDTSPAIYSILTLSNASAKTVDGGTLTTSSDFNTSGGAVNLNTNNPAVTIGGNWTNSTTVTQGSGAITADGNYTNSGIFTTGTGGVFFNGSVTQAIQDNSVAGTTFNNVTFENTSAKTMSGTGLFAVSSSGVLTMAGTATLATGGILTLNSGATGSAAVAPITSGNPISGNVNVQRYFQGSNVYDNVSNRYIERNYRIISSPVNIGIKVNGNNVYGLNYIVGATAGQTTGANSPTNVFITGCTGGSTSGGNPSIYLYREDLTPSNAGFTAGNYIGITNITNSTTAGTIGASDGNTYSIPVGNGIFFFYRGAATNWATRTVSPFIAPEPVTLTSTGVLNQGTITVNDWFIPSSGLSFTAASPVAGFNMVGNPYACSIDWNTYFNNVGISTTNISPFIYEFNPVTGNFDTYQNTGAGTGLGTGNGTNIIASGQGFFVHATGASPTLQFTENAKSATSQVTGLNLLMAKSAPAIAVNQLLRLKMITDTLNYDDLIIEFNSAASTKYNNMEDGLYVGGTSALEGLSSLSADNIKLTINSLPLPNQSPQVIKLNVTAVRTGQYTIQRTALEAVPQIYDVWLMDHNKKDSLDLRKNTTYVFNIDLSDTSTFGSSRFSVVIRQDPALSVKLLSFTATKVTNGAEMVWKTQNEQNYTYFTIERSNNDGKTFVVLGGPAADASGEYSFLDKAPPIGADKYRLKIVDLNGTITYSNIVTLIYTNSTNHDINSSDIVVYPNPTSGKVNLTINKTTVTSGFTIQISNNLGVVVKSGNSSQPYWQTDMGDLMPGTYFIQVINKKDNSLVGRNTIVKL